MFSSPIHKIPPDVVTLPPGLPVIPASRPKNTLLLAEVAFAPA